MSLGSKKLIQNESATLMDYPETADIETSSEDYARRFSGKVGSWFLKVQEEATLKMLAPHAGASILDVGGGHGQLTGALIQGGYRVCVFGSSEICKKRIQEFIDADNCEFRAGNLLSLPWQDRAFDAVISYRLLPHIERWKELVSELARVAREAVIVDYPSSRSINFISPLLFGLKKRLERNTRPFALFKESELLEVFGRHGFVRAGRYPEFFFPMVLHRALKSQRSSVALEELCRLCGLTSLFGSPVILKLTRES